MNNIGMDALAVSFLLLIVWRMEIVKEKGKSNRLYLSQDSSKMIRGIMAILVVFHHLAQRTSGGTIFSSGCVFLLFRLWVNEKIYAGQNV